MASKRYLVRENPCFVPDLWFQILQAGIKVSIFERAVSAQTFRPRDWTLALHWGLPLIKSLLPDDMAARLVKETYVDPNLDWDSSPCDRMRMYNGLTGAMMKEVTVEGQIGRISRKKLINFLALGIDIQVCHELMFYMQRAADTW